MEQLTNFDFLKAEPKFAGFADAAISAEKILNIGIAALVLQVDKSKFEIKQSLEMLELLKKALIQKYFG